MQAAEACFVPPTLLALLTHFPYDSAKSITIGPSSAEPVLRRIFVVKAHACFRFEPSEAGVLVKHFANQFVIRSHDVTA